MKITSFNPMIISKDADSIVQMFEGLGFEKRHTKTGIRGGEMTSIRMKDAGGFYVDVVSSEHVTQDQTAIRINVDDFLEAYNFFISHGFTNPSEEKITETGSSFDLTLYAPSGFAVTICKHIKK